MRDHRPLRVLLISPVASLDPGSGDVTYTEQLLASPPPGVSYTTYDEALTAGALVEVGARASLRGGTPRKQAQAAALAVCGQCEDPRLGVRLRWWGARDGEAAAASAAGPSTTELPGGTTPDSASAPVDGSVGSSPEDAAEFIGFDLGARAGR